MAERPRAAPFKSQQLPDIAPARQIGGVKRGPGPVDAVKAVSGILVPAIREQHIQGLKEDVLGQTKTVKEFLKLARTPSLLLTEFGTEAIENPAVRAAINDFVAVRDATDQGKLPQQFALERLETIQNNAIRDAPEFEKEIRQAMIQATGQDPAKTLFAQFLSTTKTALTPQQKAANNIAQQAAEHSFTFEQQLEQSHNIALSEGEQAKFKLLAAQGKITAFGISDQINRIAGTAMLRVLSLARKELKRNGKLSQDFVRFLKVEAGTIQAAAQLDAVSQLKNLDPTAVSNATAPIREIAKNVSAMLDDGAMLGFLQDEVAVQKLVIENKVLDIPGIGTAYGIAGPQGFAQMLKGLKFIAGSVARKKTLLDLDPQTAALFALTDIPIPKMVNVIPNLYRGIVPINKTEQGAFLLMGGNQLKGVLTESERQTIMEGMDTLSPSILWTSLGNPEIVARNRESKTGIAKVIEAQERQSALLADEFLLIARTPGFDLKRFTFVNDTLTVERDPEEQAGVGDVEAVNLARQFAGRFNRANNISAINHRAQILPKNSWSSTEMYWNAITNPESPQNKERVEQAPPTPKVDLEVIFDADGNLIFKE